MSRRPVTETTFQLVAIEILAWQKLNRLFFFYIKTHLLISIVLYLNKVT